MKTSGNRPGWNIARTGISCNAPSGERAIGQPWFQLLTSETTDNCETWKETYPDWRKTKYRKRDDQPCLLT